MLRHKVAIISGALIALGAGSMAHATELGARAVLSDQYQNQRALQEQDQYKAYHNRFEHPRAMTRTSRIDGIDAADIAHAQGIDEVENVSQSRGAWTVDGTDRLGEEMLVRVNSHGQVLSVSTRAEPLGMWHY
jgi:hypothetical protein